MRMNELVDLSQFKLEKENQQNKINYNKRENTIRKENIMRGDIFYADLTKARELGRSVQAEIRPVIIISNDAGNKFSPNVNIVPVTSKIRKILPPHLKLKLQCLDVESIVLNENVMTIGKELLRQKVGHCTEEIMLKVSNKLNMQMKTIPELDLFKLGRLVKHIKRFTKKVKYFETDEFKEILETFYDELNEKSILYQIPVEKMMNMFNENGELIRNAKSV